jgi:phosphate transport system permease protein
MTFLGCLAAILVIATTASLAGTWRARVLCRGQRKLLHSLPLYHGLWPALLALMPAVVFLHVAIVSQPAIVGVLFHRSSAEHLETLRPAETAHFLARVRRLATDPTSFADPLPVELAHAGSLRALRSDSSTAIAGMTVLISILGGAVGLRQLTRDFRARNSSERVLVGILAACAMLAIVTTVSIVLSLLAESLRFFAIVPPIDFLFGLEWRPQAAIHADQMGVASAFGVVPVLVGTLLISLIAVLVAGPIGLFSAIYMVEFADPGIRRVVKPLIEVLAGIPTVVYGFFAAIAVAPFIRDVGSSSGVEVSANSALAAGFVMGIMIIPFVSSLADDVIGTVPHRLRDAAYSLGATQAETVVQVVLPAALPGLLSALVLAVSRALGETMIVVMAAGLFAHLTINPLEAVTTMTAQITSVLTGDQPFDSPTTLSAFALGLTLFVATLAMNIAALRIMEAYRERYE